MHALTLAAALVMAAPGMKPVPAVTQLAWMAGAWTSDQGDSRGESHWMPPRDGVMVGMFRLNGGGKTLWVELLTITQGKTGPVLRIRHFDPQLKAWEKEKTPLTYTAAKITEGHVIFTNPDGDVRRLEFVASKTGLTIRLVQQMGESTKTLEFRYRRSTKP